MKKDETTVLTLLESLGVVREGHFRARSGGKHLSSYIDKNILYSHPLETDEVCDYMAGLLVDNNIEVVVAPATGGITLSHLIAYHLFYKKGNARVRSVFVEKDGDTFVFRRRYYRELVHNKRVAIAEDVITSGSSVRKVIDATRAAGGEVIKVVAMWNRGNITADDLGVPELQSLLNNPLPSWTPDECPLCAQGIPITILRE